MLLLSLLYLIHIWLQVILHLALDVVTEGLEFIMLLLKRTANLFLNAWRLIYNVTHEQSESRFKTDFVVKLINKSMMLKIVYVCFSCSVFVTELLSFVVLPVFRLWLRKIINVNGYRNMWKVKLKPHDDNSRHFTCALWNKIRKWSWVAFCSSAIRTSNGSWISLAGGGEGHLQDKEFQITTRQHP